MFAAFEVGGMVFWAASSAYLFLLGDSSSLLAFFYISASFFGGDVAAFGDLFFVIGRFGGAAA